LQDVNESAGSTLKFQEPDKAGTVVNCNNTRFRSELMGITLDDHIRLKSLVNFFLTTRLNPHLKKMSENIFPYLSVLM